MNNNAIEHRFPIRFPYIIGIAADALWAVALFFPPLFAVLTGQPDFSPDIQVRLIMAIGGLLMSGWTVLLVWGVMRPVERRFLLLLTSCVVAGMFIIAFIGIHDAGIRDILLMTKIAVVFSAMLSGYAIAEKRARYMKYTN